jgi:eukaryotic-like serine/threonine-protein kinase
MMKNLVGQQLGNYQLVRLLGRGGFAEVYLGRHRHLQTPAAIKVLSAHLADDEIQKFLQEARVIAALVHPNIVRVLDFDVANGLPFLVMDYCPQGTLRQRHATGGRLDLVTAINYAGQMAEALQYAHEHKLIHRDVKPENMLIGKHNEILLSDFGIASSAHSTSSMNTQIPVGTIPYMAPEQIQAQARPASDQYALGVVVYEWLCGERPFVGTYVEIFAKHLMMAPPPLRQKVPSLPPAVEQAVLIALAKDPHQRFASVRAFAGALRLGSQPSWSTLGSRTTHQPINPPTPAQPEREMLTSAALAKPDFRSLRATPPGGVATIPIDEQSTNSPFPSLIAPQEAQPDFTPSRPSHNLSNATAYTPDPPTSPPPPGSQKRPEISRRAILMTLGAAIAVAGGASALYWASNSQPTTTSNTSNLPIKTAVPASTP